VPYEFLIFLTKSQTHKCHRGHKVHLIHIHSNIFGVVKNKTKERKIRLPFRKSILAAAIKIPEQPLQFVQTFVFQLALVWVWNSGVDKFECITPRATSTLTFQQIAVAITTHRVKRPEIIALATGKKRQRRINKCITFVGRSIWMVSRCFVYDLINCSLIKCLS